MTFGEKLKQSRESKGISQAELARKIGVSRAAVTRYESGERKEIAAPIVIAICDVLGVPPAEMFPDQTSAMLALKYSGREDMSYDPDEDAFQRDYEYRCNKAALLREFDSLNELGQAEAVKRIRELGMVAMYKGGMSDGQR